MNMSTDKIPAELKYKVRILIVEDNTLNQKIAGFMLKEWGFKYDTCADGKLALDFISGTKYDLILMDVQMPVMNGYQATEYIRKTLKLSIPIIATTAHASGAEKDKCFSYGMTDYITKPIRGAELNQMLVDYLFPAIPDLKEI